METFKKMELPTSNKGKVKKFFLVHAIKFIGTIIF